MKRFVGLTLVFSGAVFGIFVLNLFLYAYNPDYHNAVEAAVIGDSDIPVVTADGVTLNSKNVVIEETKEIPLAATYEKTEIPSQTVLKDEEVCQEDESAEKGPSIVDKEYHEDCGTGEGYWIIKYSDGSVEVE